MALEPAGVRLTADGKAQYLQALNQASQATLSFGKAAQDTANQVNRVGRAAADVSKGQQGIAGLASELKSAAAAFGLMAVAREAFNASQLAADAIRAERALVAFSGSARDAARNLEAVQRATGYAISGMEASRQAAGLLGTGMVQSTADLERFVRVATTLGAAFAGLSAPEAIQELKLTFLNQSIERLDSFGISSGKVRDRIKELQAANKDLNREQAFFIASMEQAEVSMQKLGAAGFDASSGLAEAQAAAVDLRVELGRNLLPTVDLVAAGLARIFRGTADANQEQRAYTEAARRLVIELIAQGKVEEALQLQRNVAIATSARDVDLLKRRVTETAAATGTTSRLVQILAEMGVVSKETEPSIFDLLRGIEGIGDAAAESEKKARGFLGAVSDIAGFTAQINKAFRPEQPDLFDWMRGVRGQVKSGLEAQGQTLESRIDPARSAVTAAKERARATQEQIREVQRDGARQLAELAQESGRRLAEIDRNAAQQRIDLARDFAQERVDLARDMARDEARALQDFARESARIEQDRAREAIRIARDRARDAIREARDEARDEARSQRDRARTEQRALQDHLERLRQIDMQYAQSRREAIRNRDGKALSDAIRTHRTQRSEAERDFDIASRRRQEDYEEQRRDRQEAIEIARRDREEQYRQEDADRAEAYREEDRDREAAFRQEQQDRAEAYRVRLADMQAQFQREQARITEAAQRQRDEWLRSYAQQRADIVSANRERLAALQVQLNSEVAAVYRAVQQMMEVYKAYYEWLVAMQRWAAAAGATPTTSTTPPTASSSSSTVPAGSGGGGGSSQSSVSAIRPSSSPFMSTATVSPPARPTAGGGGGGIVTNVVVNAPGATAATVDAIRQAVRQEMVPVVNRMAQAFT